ncbi:MAG: Fe-S cluster domain-containing protein [Bacillota bacterium]
MLTAVYVFVVLTALGLVFGFILAYANKKFALEVNPLIHLVDDVLPKGQCGACGFAGCMAYAEAVVLDANVPPNLCIPGKADVANLVAELTGKKAEATAPKIAFVSCAGSPTTARAAYNYQGIPDCDAAALLMGGPKICKNGCLGFGTCVKACVFNALELGENHLPIVNSRKCTGCGACEKVCPKNVIKLIPLGAHVALRCNTREKGAIAKKSCSVACISCTLCVRECPYGAIKMENNVPIVNYKICSEQCNEAKCVAKCPTKAIIQIK